MKVLVSIFLICICFAIGSYSWYLLKSSQHDLVSVQSLKDTLKSEPTDVLLDVGGRQVTYQDVDFEYLLLTKGVLAQAQSDLTPVPDYGGRLEQNLGPLKESILKSIVERILLYQLVGQDQTFDLSGDQRFESCLSVWTKVVKEEVHLFVRDGDKERLKSRLCEQSIIEQYANEKIYPDIVVDEAQVQEYFKDHRGDFVMPAMVQIRQIVLADERQAKITRSKMSRKNFAELARKYSITPEAEDGGLLPSFPAGYGMPRFFEVAFAMKLGQISTILKSTYGFHIIMLEKKVKPRELGFAESIGLIKKKLAKREKERAYQKWVDLALHSIKVATPRV